MEQPFTVAPSGARTDKNVLIQRTTENVRRHIAQRREIIERFADPQPKESYLFAVARAKKYLVETHREAGIELDEREIPSVVFIDKSKKKDLRTALKPVGGGVGNEFGKAVLSNGVTIIYTNENITDLDYAAIIFHEMFHSVGISVVAANEKEIMLTRQGFEIGTEIKSALESWVLEEGLMTYEAVQFAKQLGRTKEFIDDAILKKLSLEYVEKTWGMKDGRIQFHSIGMEAEPEYCVGVFPPGKTDTVSIGVKDGFTLPGSLFGTLVGVFAPEEQKAFLKTACQARRDLKKIPVFAGMIDAKWGKGTYAQLLHCKRSNNAVWEVLKELRARPKPVQSS